MKTQADKTQESQNSITPRVSQEPSNGGTTQLVDNRTTTIDQRKLQKTMNTSTENSANPIPRKETPERSRRANKTGLPDNLKSGIENLSGYSMDDVKVHYNSSKPAQLQAHAYAQGTDIHLAPGQQKHLPHEAWHVVQQKQGRVKPTRQLKSKVNINDDAGLEKEADVMGTKAIQKKSIKINDDLIVPAIGKNVLQREVIGKGGRVNNDEEFADLNDEMDDFLLFDNYDGEAKQKSKLNEMITGEEGFVINCGLHNYPLSFNSAKSLLRGKDVELDNSFERLGKPSMNKQAYRIKDEPWVALVVPKTTTTLAGIKSKEDKLVEEVEELKGIAQVPIETPNIGDGEVIDCYKNTVPAVGFIQEFMEGEELDKRIRDVDLTNFINYAIDDITSETFYLAREKFRNMKSSMNRIRNHIIGDKKVIHDFQIFYQKSTGKILVFDPGDPAAPDPNRNKRVLRIVKILHDNLTDSRMINRKWKRKFKIKRDPKSWE